MSNPYEAACIAANLRPRRNIIDAYEQAVGVETGVELKCHGNHLAEGHMLDVDLKLLAEAMLQPHPFDRLEISYNELGSESGEALKNLLEADTRLRSLDLTCNELAPAPCCAILKGLEKNSALQELRMSGNMLGDEAGLQLAELLQVNDTLRQLHLANCGLKMVGLVGLATALQTNRAVAVLDVQRALVHCPMETHVEHFGRLLAVSSTLKELDLSKCGVSDRGLIMLASALRKAGANTPLKTLRLRANQISLADADAVDVLGLLLGSAECTLEHLDLSANSLGDAGALVLSEIVKTNCSLASLALSYNGINSRGLCALAHGVAAHRSLRSLTLWGNRFDSAACLAWTPAMSRLELDFRSQEVDGTFMPVAA